MKLQTTRTATPEHQIPAGEALERINRFARNRVPFVFALDFDLLYGLVLPLHELDPRQLRFRFARHADGLTTGYSPRRLKALREAVRIKKTPPQFERYRAAFNHVQQGLRNGDSFLANLTLPVSVELSHSLPELYAAVRAKYTLLIEDRILVFSPEQFVRIQDGVIRSYPMKGTIRASEPNAAACILNDEKEKAEHLTIVDLIRNDIGRIAERVRVERYRYIDRIQLRDDALLQISSEIVGELPRGFESRLGELLFEMLPAGSITGAPKRRTVEIIREAERYERGYYTGICGVWDGHELDSGVMIRFIEQTDHGTVFKAGGGITIYSELEREYQELLDKVNVPLH